MKKIIFLMWLLPLASFATTIYTQTATSSAYQELCAKERDPIKRQHYCLLFERNGQASPAFTVFRKETAFV